MRVRLSDFITALRESYTAEAHEASGPNHLLSRREQGFLASVDLANATKVVEQSGASRPFKASLIIDAALDHAEDAIAAVNQTAGSGHVFVSKKELRALPSDIGGRATKIWETLSGGGSDQQTRAAFLSALSPLIGSHQAPAIEIEQISKLASGTRIDFNFSRDDGGIFRGRAVLNNGELSAIEVLAQSPAVDPELGASIQEAVGGQAVNVLGYVHLPDGRLLAAYERPFDEEHAPDRQLVTVEWSGTTSTVQNFVPGDDDVAVLRELALMMTRSQALRLGSNSPAMTLEAQLRIARLGAADLEAQTSEESPVGFDPNSEVVQLMASSVLGDNAVVTTFDRSGNFRLEDVG